MIERKPFFVVGLDRCFVDTKKRKELHQYSPVPHTDCSTYSIIRSLSRAVSYVHTRQKQRGSYPKMLK